MHSKFQQTTAELSLFLSSHGTFTKMEHTMGHNPHLKNVKRLENGT